MQVLTASWSNNGKRLATGGYDNVIKIWRIEPRVTVTPVTLSLLAGPTCVLPFKLTGNETDSSSRMDTPSK